MIQIIAALWMAAAVNNGEIRNLSVQPSSNRTEVVIHVDGPVSVKHSFLREGNRLVVDLTGARQATRLDLEVNRGGVLNMRVSQFQPQIVRVVLDLAAPVQYEVAHDGEVVRLSFPNTAGTFEPWNMGFGSATKAAEPVTATAESARPRPNAPAAQQQQQRRRQEERISVTFVDQPINDVLAAFAEFANRSIVAAPDISARTINAEIKEQPWDVALQAILEVNGMSIREDEAGILHVESAEASQARLTAEPITAREFRLNYVSADSLVMTVQALLSEGGKVAVNPTGNSLIVTDAKSVLDRITPLIRQMDIKPPQVNIQAKIVFVDRTALEDLGFVYDLKDSRGNQLNQVVPGFLDENGNGIFEPEERTDENVILLGGNSVAAVANANYRVASPALQILTSLVLGRHSLFTFIDALQSVSVSDVIATPTITGMDNRQSEIQVGERTPIRVVDAGAQGGGGQARAQVRLENTGIILRVTPHIIGNQVRMEIHAERSNIALAPADIGATFATQQADTEVLVENGQTAVIGGLTLIEKLKVRAGIPFLMDLPVLGALFRQESERETKRDLLIMVTPHIIRDENR